MYEQLLVALDGSLAAERVLEHTEALATAFGSNVTLLRATVSAELLLAETAGPETAGDITPMIDPTPIVEADKETAAEYLQRVAARLQQAGVTRVTYEEPEGPPTDAIVRRASELHASLIMMTTHGRSGLGRMFFGSVADSVLRHAPCPVLLVRVTDKEGEGEA
ncbi:MAG TPA: universal stress protein [Chloroflexota bacterium]|jgi:nucleotide-binding universal stress UspA family protein|nr:universal stress protein [Chloroflexota bacterium]